MKLIFKYLSLFSIFIHTITLNAQIRVENAVVFGEHSTKKPNIPKDVIRIFMDRNGHYYPDTIILDKELKDEIKGKAALKVWAKNHPSKFKIIAKSYNLINVNYNPASYKALQDSIVARISNTINNYKSDSKTFLIHGFNKEFYNPSKNTKSIADNLAIEKKIKENYNINKKHLFIEVYWDGLYSNHRIAQGKIFAFNAIPNAKKCGYSLRKLFTRLHNEEMNIINHSTGVYLAAHLLFNAKNTYQLETPSNKLHILLVAPACDRKIFKSYYKRNTNTASKKQDNYTIYNAYNPKDGILRKSFKQGKDNSKLGVDTSLGCNCKNESGKLKKHFKEKFPKSTYNDYTIDNIGKKHNFSSYIQSSKMAPVLKELYKY